MRRTFPSEPGEPSEPVEPAESVAPFEYVAHFHEAFPLCYTKNESTRKAVLSCFGTENRSTPSTASVTA